MLEPVSPNSSNITKYIVFIAMEDSIYRDFFTGSTEMVYPVDNHSSIAVEALSYPSN